MEKMKQVYVEITPALHQKIVMMAKLGSPPKTQKAIVIEALEQYTAHLDDVNIQSVLAVIKGDSNDLS